MSEFTLTVDGEDHEITDDNHTVNMFRDTPEYDYIVLRPETDPENEKRNILIFRHQWLCHWMGNIALNDDDRQRLEQSNTELGSFAGQFGFNSKTLIEDYANQFEVDYYVQGLTNDLNNGIPEDWR